MLNVSLHSNRKGPIAFLLCRINESIAPMQLSCVLGLAVRGLCAHPVVALRTIL